MFKYSNINKGFTRSVERGIAAFGRRRKAMPRFTAGFTIFFAMLAGGLALSIGIAIYDLTIRELDLSATATQSQYAIYAADTGVECALYWDYKCQGGGCNNGSAFATSSSYLGAISGVSCNGQDVALVGTPPPGSYNPPPANWTAWVIAAAAAEATTTFYISFAPQPYCAKVEVGKSGDPIQTTIISHGFNTCASGSVSQLERVLYVSY